MRPRRRREPQVDRGDATYFLGIILLAGMLLRPRPKLILNTPASTFYSHTQTSDFSSLACNAGPHHAALDAAPSCVESPWLPRWSSSLAVAVRTAAPTCLLDASHGSLPKCVSARALGPAPRSPHRRSRVANTRKILSPHSCPPPFRPTPSRPVTVRASGPSGSARHVVRTRARSAVPPRIHAPLRCVT